MKVLTSFSVIKMSEGLRISYTYTEIDEITGITKNNNVQESRFIVQDELKNSSNHIMAYIENNFLK
ncbi:MULTISPECIES: hypothetical protein [Terrisporobacter]|uniref:Uncharacterized protein n=1 Tax=Terrisporobacter muris TaxID=2963284 RepID=A0A9X2M9N4_9FIRM|nr:MULTISPECIES: hypothetical protein [Terrisporobacter]MCC3668029.1 hypothetical protein [Terrisporobacter mayombei]MCR1821802.1 hypothetical protein [Terrisporobacter muris]